MRNLILLAAGFFPALLHAQPDFQIWTNPSSATITSGYSGAVPICLGPTSNGQFITFSSTSSLWT